MAARDDALVAAKEVTPSEGRMGEGREAWDGDSWVHPTNKGKPLVATALGHRR